MNIPTCFFLNARVPVLGSWTSTLTVPGGDVAARGVDIPGVTWIVQYDTPGEERNYGRRLGHRFVRDQAAKSVSCPVYSFNFHGFKIFKKLIFCTI